MKINRFVQGSALDNEQHKSPSGTASAFSPKRLMLRIIPQLLWKLFKIVQWLLLILIIFYFSILVVFRWLPLPTSAFIWHQNQLAAHEPKIYQPAKYEWVNWESISPEIALAVISAEDQRFPTHWGIDTVELRKAISDATENHSSLRGASTLTQQLAKNLFLWNGRSYVRKVLEAGLALSLELVWSKKRILEVYLNVAQFAPVTFGVQASSERLFGKAPKDLSREEAAYLAAVLPTPAKSNVNDPSDTLKKRQRWIVKQMKQLGGTSYLKKLK